MHADGLLRDLRQPGPRSTPTTSTRAAAASKDPRPGQLHLHAAIRSTARSPPHLLAELSFPREECRTSCPLEGAQWRRRPGSPRHLYDIAVFDHSGPRSSAVSVPGVPGACYDPPARRAPWRWSRPTPPSLIQRRSYWLWRRSHRRGVSKSHRSARGGKLEDRATLSLIPGGGAASMPPSVAMIEGFPVLRGFGLHDIRVPPGARRVRLPEQAGPPSATLTLLMRRPRGVIQGKWTRYRLAAIHYSPTCPRRMATSYSAVTESRAAPAPPRSPSGYHQRPVHYVASGRPRAAPPAPARNGPRTLPPARFDTVTAQRPDHARRQGRTCRRPWLPAGRR